MGTIHSRRPICGPTFSRTIWLTEFDYWRYLVSTVNDPEALESRKDLPELETAELFPDQSEGGSIPDLHWPTDVGDSVNHLCPIPSINAINALDPDSVDWDVNGYLFLLSEFCKHKGIEFCVQEVQCYPRLEYWLIRPDGCEVFPDSTMVQQAAFDLLNRSDPAYAALLDAETAIQKAKAGLKKPTFLLEGSLYI